MEENQKKWAQVVAKAWMDESFKKELFKNPKQVLKDNGMSFDMDCKIVEAKQNELYFVLPAKPEGNLSEQELRNIAAASAPQCDTCF